MDRQHWRREAATLRREGQHMLDVAEDLERAANDSAGSAPPAAASEPSRLEVCAILVLAGLSGIGLGLLAWWQSL